MLYSRACLYCVGDGLFIWYMYVIAKTCCCHFVLLYIKDSACVLRVVYYVCYYVICVYVALFTTC